MNSKQMLLIAAVAAVAAAGTFALGTIAGGSSFAIVTAAEAADSELMVAGPLGEMTLGDPKAPNVVIEYASMTCTHCQRFHEDVYHAVQEEIHRHRQGLLHLPRASRSIRSRRRRS